MKAYLSPTAYVTPREITQQRSDGEEPHAVMRVITPHGKSQRVIELAVSEDDLLTIIANAADALRLLNREKP